MSHLSEVLAHELGVCICEMRTKEVDQRLGIHTDTT